MMYIHEHEEWPKLTWNKEKIEPLLIEVRYLQGRLLGRMEALGFSICEEATLKILTQDVLKTSEIEGERLDPEQVRSSIAKRLGLDFGSMIPIDRHVEGIVDVMLDATQHYQDPLTPERLFHWHIALFPTAKSGMQLLTVGEWRAHIMQVVSGPYGHEKIHYEAPIPGRLMQEMTKFLDWFNTSVPAVDDVIKSAIAHFWFVTIHPFDDGNGRIARAIADMMLARSEKSAQRFYSMSFQIQKDRAGYYKILERCQKGRTDITLWIEWFLESLKHAIKNSGHLLDSILHKADFWRAHAGQELNERQRQMINRLHDGFFGKLTSSKWAKLTKCSQDTASRDIKSLVDAQILIQNEGGGRSTSYQLKSIPFDLGTDKQ